MKRLLLYATALLCTLGVRAQYVSLEVEPWVEHTGMVGDVDLTGYTTYRIYVHLASPTDFVSSVYGELENPLYIQTTTNFWQSSFGGLTGPDANSNFFGFVPSLRYDSFVTIGRAESNDPGNSINVVQSSCDPWIDVFGPGGNLEIDCIFGGAWFALNGDANGVAGADLKVLVGQFTTTGVLSGLLNVQIFPNGVGANEQRITGVPFSSEGPVVAGCTDPAANNFDPDANFDDGSCIYPCALMIDEVVVSPNLCPGGNSASITVNTSGGQGNVEYQINGGNPVLANTFNGLMAGTYTITVTDNQGCTETLEVDVEDPAQLTLVTSVSSAIECNGGTASISATVSGGTGDIAYGLTLGTYNSNTPSFSGLAAGSYTIYAIDENGCTAMSNAVNVTEPSAITISSSDVTPAFCADSNDGSITVTATGGTGTLTYSIDGENFMMNGNFSGLAPGDYNIWVKDANDCLLTAGYTVLSPAAIVFDGEATSVLCNGDENGFISFGATGGSGEFEYSVNGGEFSNVSAYADLAAGDYAVVAQDVLTGCTAELLLSVDENSAVELTATVADASCNGDEDGSIMAMGAGGMMPYTYSIDGGAPQANGTFDDLAAGDYDVTVTDDNGCSVTETITVTEPAALTVDSDVVGDDGSGNGEIDITVTGGTPNYSYEWSGPGGFSSTSQDIDGLDGGSYTVTVTDENDCEITETIVVSTGIEEFFNGITVEVYPNPSNGEFVLTLSGMNGETINLNIVDALGRNVINTQLNGAGVVRHDINLNNVEGGVYFLQLVADGAAHVTRLIKQ
jgi:hypothetical protein